MYFLDGVRMHLTPLVWLRHCIIDCRSMVCARLSLSVVKWIWVQWVWFTTCGD